MTPKPLTEYQKRILSHMKLGERICIKEFTKFGFTNLKCTTIEMLEKAGYVKVEPSIFMGYPMFFWKIKEVE